MSLADEYRRQFAWRDWNRALELCPIVSQQRVLDLGCGPGDISAELSARGLSVTLRDQELSFDGPARSDVLAAWQARFDRMGA